MTARIGQLVHYVMEGRENNHVPALVAYVDEESGNVNLMIPAGSKVGKGFLPAPVPRIDVAQGAPDRPMTWHHPENISTEAPADHAY